MQKHDTRVLASVLNVIFFDSCCREHSVSFYEPSSKTKSLMSSGIVLTNMMRMRQFATATVLLMSLGAARATLVNERVARAIDVTGVLAIHLTAVTLRNDGDAAASSFVLAVHAPDANALADLVVSDPSVSTGAKFTALPMQVVTNVPGLRSCCKGYRVTLRKPIKPGASKRLIVHMDVAGVVVPVPAKVKEDEDQFMRFTGNAYFYSPYVTEDMTTTITLGSSLVTSKSLEAEPFSVKGKTMTAGPYTDVQPFSHAPMTVRFKNARGFLVASSAVKQFYVSHWGNIAVKEEFKLSNAGAQLEGAWSRIDYSRLAGSMFTNAIGDVWANLPPDATNVEYKDLLGNVTSSRLRKPTRKHRAVKLEFRFPLVGGWKNHFWYTYDILLQNYGMSKGHEHVISLPIFPSINEDMLCQELQLRVLLPEGATDIEVLPHKSLVFDVQRTVERTTLNFIGRPVVTLTRNAIRSASKHERRIQLRYHYAPSRMAVAPSIVICGVFSFFLACMVYVRAEIMYSDESSSMVAKKDL